MDISFVLLQGILTLEPLAAAFRLANEPGISFTGFLVLLKAKEDNFFVFNVNLKVLHVATGWPNGEIFTTHLDSELKVLWQKVHWCTLDSPEGSGDSEQCRTLDTERQ